MSSKNTPLGAQEHEILRAIARTATASALAVPLSSTQRLRFEMLGLIEDRADGIRLTERGRFWVDQPWTDRPEPGDPRREYHLVRARSVALLQRRVTDALVDFEPRVDVMSVTVTAKEAARGRLDVEIIYRVRASNNVHNLVYPFYLDEGRQQT